MPPGREPTRLEDIEHEPGLYGRTFADVYDTWYAVVDDTEATVRRLAAIIGNGRALELGSGTGRLAIPLADAGVDIVGLDAAPEMLHRLRAKSNGSHLDVVCADMAALPFPASSMGTVFVAYNTFFNLVTEAAQCACLAESARILDGSGTVVIEAFVPPDASMPVHGTTVRSLDRDVTVTISTTHDAGAQVIRGEHTQEGASGRTRRPWVLRYLTPRQLDHMAKSCGLDLEQRWSDWSKSPFSPTSENHVSLYRRRGDSS